jgi:excisionase family DNA binding protein
MVDEAKEILTTSETAKILGVSVRTAQLLIEGGTIPSWKTPGGHRRVYRRDVLALVPDAVGKPALASARVILIARPERLADYEAALATAPSCVVESYADPYSALLAIGRRAPAAVVIEAEPPTDRGRLMEALQADPALHGTQILLVGATAPLRHDDRAPAMGRMRFIEGPAGLRDAAEAAVHGSSQLPSPFVVEPSFAVPGNEAQRLLALERSGLVDTPPEDVFDRLTWLAARTLEMPIALITLLTPTRQWFKSRQGLDMADTPRSWAFCNHTILQNQCMVAEDLAADPRFADNPAVVDAPNFRFYAGCPVVDPDGFILGSLCVIDTRPRTLDETQKQILTNLAALVSDEIKLRATDSQLRRAMDTLDRRGR